MQPRRGLRFVRAKLVIAVVTGAVALNSTDALAETLLSTEQHPTPVAAYAGHVVWSTTDPASGGYGLVDYTHGATRMVGVRARRVPFDVSVGPGANGKATAVYSRCGAESKLADPATGLPDYAFGRGCTVRRIALDGGREREAVDRQPKGASDFLPTIWRDEVAFARTQPNPRTKEGFVPHLFLYAAAIGKTRPALPLSSHFYSRYELDRREGTGFGSDHPRPRRLRLSSHGLALLWNGQPPLASPCNRSGADIAAQLDELWSVGGNRRARRIAASCARQSFVGLGFSGETFSYFARSQGCGSPDARAELRVLGPGRPLAFPGPACPLDLDRTGSVTVYSRRIDPAGTTQVISSD